MQKVLKLPKTIQEAALGVLLDKTLQALEEQPEECDKNFFNATSFHRFHVYFFKLFSPRLTDQADSDSRTYNLSRQLRNEDHPVISSDQEATALQKKKEKGKFLLPALKLNLILLQVLKFLRNKLHQHLADILVTLKTC